VPEGGYSDQRVQLQKLRERHAAPNRWNRFWIAEQILDLQDDDDELGEEE
jgi:hypothetical protein